MEQLRKAGQRARAFVSGDYPGAPIDYVMALVMVASVAVVILAAR